MACKDIRLPVNMKIILFPYDLFLARNITERFNINQMPNHFHAKHQSYRFQHLVFRILSCKDAQKMAKKEREHTQKWPRDHSKIHR